MQLTTLIRRPAMPPWKIDALMGLLVIQFAVTGPALAQSDTTAAIGPIPGPAGARPGGYVDRLTYRSEPATTHLRRDNDDNPPGPRGGRGTNWENPPGPRGGPGASPDPIPWPLARLRHWLADHPRLSGDPERPHRERRPERLRPEAHLPPPTIRPVPVTRPAFVRPQPVRPMTVGRRR